MDLNNPTPEHLAYMVEGIKAKLRVVTAASIKAEHFSLDNYEDIKELYELIISKDRFSISEIEALCDELKNLKQ